MRPALLIGFFLEVLGNQPDAMCADIFQILALGRRIAICEDQMATVLVVDDEPVIRSMMSEVLQHEGHSVLTAGSSAQALSLFRSHRREIDLLISDIVMPETDGPALATKMQAERPGLPVLLMSGCCDSRQVNSSFEFLPKPFSISDLLQRVRSLAERREAA